MTKTTSFTSEINWMADDPYFAAQLRVVLSTFTVAVDGDPDDTTARLPVTFDLVAGQDPSVLTVLAHCAADRDWTAEFTLLFEAQARLLDGKPVTVVDNLTGTFHTLTRTGDR
jgi:hypothetical protein